MSDTTDRQNLARAAAAAVLGESVERVHVRVSRDGGRPRGASVTDAEIVAAVQASTSLRAAARALGISHDTVRRIARAAGVAPRKSSPDAEIEKK